MRTLDFRGLRVPIASLALISALAGASAAATITIINLDGPGEGFNDPTPAAPVGGNPATTIGGQRLFVFQHAASIWGGTIPSTVQIRVNAQFSPQTCNASGAVLGGASAGSSHRNFAGAPFPGTWYQQSLANRLAGFDLNATVNDIDITFNSTLGQPGCPFCWYYGIDGNEGTCVELLPVVLHELGHGLGFATITLAGVQMGTPPGPHVYDRFLYDLTQGQHWNEMATDAQRGASAQNCQMLTWDGLCVNLSAPSVLGPKPLLRVNSPATIASDYEVGLATFGPTLATPGVTGNLVLAQDGFGVPTNGCEPFTNAAAISGNIALVDRGGCPFVLKAKNAQLAGAIGVVVADSVPGCPPPGMSGVDPTITIPTVRITNTDGATIKSQLVGGVNVTLTADPALDAGTAAGRVLVYTPIPFALGSSVSHWDVSAEPSLLMEPAITTGLSSGTDLTVQQFQDIGWFGTPAPCGATATTLAFFVAESHSDGILLRWQFGPASDAAEVLVERSVSSRDVWVAIRARVLSGSGEMSALDTEAEPGQSYDYRLRVTGRSGDIELLGATSGTRALAPAGGVSLGLPRPNPTEHGSAVTFRISRPEFVRLSVMDVNGRRVRELHQGMLPAGEHTRTWDGRTERLERVAPGVYLVSLRTSAGVTTQRVVIAP
ncbi:MAG: PA domain-containing protein [Candidatus Eisenbacteria bacterium]